MNHNIKLSLQLQIQSFRNPLFQLPELPFSDIFSTSSLQQIIEGSSCKRNHIFTPLVTLKAFISQVLSADGSCRQAVSQVLPERIGQGKKGNSINTSSYCKARGDLPLGPLINAVTEAGKSLHDQSPSAWRWKGHNTLIKAHFLFLGN